MLQKAQQQSNTTVSKQSRGSILLPHFNLGDTMGIADVEIDEKIEQITLEPKKYKVIMLNDDTTPMEWVIDVLTYIFKHSEATAKDITMKIHNEGSGIAGVYTYEIAEQKTAEAITASRENGFPLAIKMERE